MPSKIGGFVQGHPLFLALNSETSGEKAPLEQGLHNVSPQTVIYPWEIRTDQPQIRASSSHSSSCTV